MKRLLFGALSVGLVVGFAAACTSDPTEVLRGGVSRVTLSQSFVQILVGDSVPVVAQALDDQGNQQSSLPVPSTGDASIATVSPNADLTLRPATQAYFFIKGIGYGTAIVMATAAEGGAADTIAVETFPASIAITGVPDTMRSGDVATYVLTPVDVNGAAVTGVSGLVTVVDDSDILVLDTTATTVDADEAGFASIDVVGPGPTTGPTEGTFGVRVMPGVPASAALSATDFGAMAAAATSTLEIQVFDANGNQNNVIAEITSATAVSSVPGVATVAVAIVDTMEAGTLRQVFATVTGVAAGTVDITGDITTTEGVFAYASTPATVLNPVVTPATPSGASGSTITINGTGLAATGFTTLVLVDGAVLGNILTVSATQITAQAPLFDAPGTWDLEVSVGGVVSNTDTWTQTNTFDELATEDNDFVLGGTPIPASLPLRVSGAFIAEPVDAVTTGAGNDYYAFTLSADATIHVVFTWVGGPDNDVLMVDAAFTGWQCGFAGATGANPEDFTCDLAAGDYMLILDNYDLADATYTAVVEIEQ